MNIINIEDKKSKMNMKWINVKDSLPEHGKEILVYLDNKDNKRIFICGFVDHQEMMNSLKTNGVEVNEKKFEHEIEKHYFVSLEVPGRCFNYITHWMPLPQYPK